MVKKPTKREEMILDLYNEIDALQSTVDEFAMMTEEEFAKWEEEL